MSPEQHQKVTELFSALYELKPEERRQALARLDDASLRAEVESLFESHVRPGPFLEKPPDVAGLIALPELPQELPLQIGRYAIRRVIAAGGMGVVYEAVQENPHRTVALKVLRRGLSSTSALRRFQVEAEMLARLDHPGIARVFDAGTHDDQSVAGWGEQVPYFAMELVSGESLVVYARGRALDTEKRIELMIKVCDAIHHAHQHGIIHRDLKPDNILVTAAGEPKLLDFGVARAADADLWTTTLAGESGLLLGTVPYMSPEQIDGQTNDVRSDVYAMGVLLFELLTGRLPHDLTGLSLAEAIRRVRQTRALRLDGADPRLRGDLATIVSTAMDPDPTRRYQSAAEFAADLRRYLARQPIQARPATALYHARMFARRHTTAVLSAAAIACLLAAAAAISVLQAVEASRQRNAAIAAKQRSDHDLRDATAVSGFLLDVFLGTADQPMLDRLELLSKAESEVNTSPPEDPRVEAKLREFIGHGFLKLEYSPRAEPHLTRALELRRTLGVEDEDLAKSLHLLAMQRLAQGRVPEGQDLLRQSLLVRRRLFGPDHFTTHPDEELRFFVARNLPDEPENAAAERDRQTLREKLPVALPPSSAALGTPVFADEFDSTAIESNWKVETRPQRQWRTRTADSRLFVEADGDTEQGTETQMFYLYRPFSAAADFQVSARIGWGGTDPERVAQAISLDLLGPGRRVVAKACYSDVWVQWRGERQARIGYLGETDRDVLRMRSGYDTLPGKGVAELTIRREGHQVSVFWDGHPILHGRCDDPVAELSISFAHVRYSGPEGTAQPGTMWVDRVAAWAGPGPR